MKITPLEIRQKRFEKKFMGGYEQTSVEAFLVSLSQEWERMLDENKALKLKIESNERDLQKMREVESSLFKTLKTAEDTGETMVKQATSQSEIMLREANLKAQETLANAERLANQMLENAKNEVAVAERDLTILENYRDNMMSEVKLLVNETLDKMTRSAARYEEAAKERKSSMKYELGVKKDSAPRQTYYTASESDMLLKDNGTSEKANEDGSFFDKVGG